MRKPVKPKAAPKVKHKAFTSFMHRLQGEDWIIGIFNPNDKTAAYFLAEPTTPITSKTMNTNQHPGKLSGYMVSALSRQGVFENTIPGLPRKFKTHEDAAEWLEGQVEQYDGDEAVEVIADFKYDPVVFDLKNPKVKVDYSDGRLYDNGVEQFVKQTEYFASEAVKDPGKAGAVTGRTSPAGDTYKGPSFESAPVTSKKKTKAVNKPKPATSHEKKFKTSREELDSLGLGDLFDD